MLVWVLVAVNGHCIGEEAGTAKIPNAHKNGRNLPAWEGQRGS